MDWKRGHASKSSLLGECRHVSNFHPGTRCHWCVQAHFSTLDYATSQSTITIAKICRKRARFAKDHTKVIDIVTLSNDRPYALIGQVHGGLLGWFQRRLSGCTEHVWFERSELRDRTAVGRRLRDHTKDPRNYPCLIFPEGTCINNTSVMQFKKCSFEATDRIYPG